MNRNHRRALVCACMALLTDSATAAPVVLDTEQKATDVWVTVSPLQRSVEFDLSTITDDARRFVLTSMKDLAAVTTPQALRSLPGGLSLPCAFGGSFHATLKQQRAKVLHINWAGCSQSGDEFSTSSLNGPIRVTLISDTFAPDVVAAIRVGNESHDVTWVEHFTDTEFPQTRTRAYNYRMVGLISMQRLFDRGLFIGPFYYRLNGFSRERTETLGFPDVISVTSADGVLVSGTREYSDNNTIVTETMHVVRGTVTEEQDFSGNRRLRSYTAQGFRTYNRMDFNDFVTATADHAIDGKVRFQFVEGYPTECVNGEYSIKTKVRVHTPSLFTSSSEFDQGEIVLNNSVRVRFYSRANVPVGLPVPQGGMLTTIDVENVGLFSYDSDPSAPNSIFNVARCF